MFNQGRTNAHDKDQNRKPLLVKDVWNQKLMENFYLIVDIFHKFWKSLQCKNIAGAPWQKKKNICSGTKDFDWSWQDETDSNFLWIFYSICE